MSTGMVTLAKGDASGIVDPHRTVVRDSQAWLSLWSAHAGPATQAPAVDFATSMVLAAFAGERPTPGYSVEIVEPRQVGSSLVVTVTEAVPPRGMIAAQMIVTPFHIVALPRADGDIRFTDAAGSPFRGASLMYAQSPDVPNPARTIVPPEGPISSPTAASSTGLEPSLAAALAYLAGPFSGILILLVERANGFVLFHAWQAVIGLGGLGILSAGTLVFSFLTLLLSPLAFTVMYRLSAVLAIVWVIAWAVCLIQAFAGRWWLMPIAGRYAERLAGHRKTLNPLQQR